MKNIFSENCTMNEAKRIKLMSKSSITILKEKFDKIGLSPIYEYEVYKTETTNFKCQITINNELSASGEGFTKKEAKHAAAQSMLDVLAYEQNGVNQQCKSADSSQPSVNSNGNGKLSLPQLPVDPIRQSTDPSEPFVNFIGMLKDLSERMQLNVVYKLESEGPAHAKVFKYQCAVLNFTENGIASTKKQAKQRAAKKMYERIEEYRKNNGNVLTNDNNNLDSRDDATNKRYQAIDMPNYHRQMVINYDDEFRRVMIKKLQLFKEQLIKLPDNMWYGGFLYDMEKKLEDILSPMNVRVKSTIFPAHCGYIVTVHFSTKPEIADVRVGDKCTMIKCAYLNAIDKLKIFLA